MASAAQATATSTSQTTPNREIDKPLGGEQTTNGNSVAEEVAPPAPSPETTSPATTAPVAQAEETQKSPSARAPTLTPVIPPAPVLIAPGPAPASRRKSKSKTPIQDASNSMRIHVDGRVKNPIPSRIQHIAKKDSGNFSVMHIGVSGTLSEDPDAAARRTSQRTEAQARQASQGGWQPPKRSRAAWHTDEPVTLLTSQALASTPRSRQQPPSTGPAPQEAKSEQARLLTLLRTLHPMLVVDQLCKALAYFGGIPGAPPPTDGSFPPSATKNGSGALLVGWLSEIFPHVENPPLLAPPLQIPSRASATSAAPAPDASRWSDATPSGATPSKRPRGRPKGSKSSKARKDKGIKKSHPVAAQGADDSQPTMGGDGDGIDGATNVSKTCCTSNSNSSRKHRNRKRQALETPLPQQVSEMGSFATYNEQSFLNMDYGLTERDLQDAEAVMGRHDG
ncbi:DNA binding with preference for A/T rich regions-like protein [Purpureocillium lavendulum]|uniref:DNA binding with preference for A/T rich regions-like protein n=1 Tax=Purpureocillium lavendulum TaxID=1247861 RepID=A0AB34G2T0_9HYPO|nr:DNA binding with preference for A/T rich regions-like protein [Purpureocillium lavendulum]